jgi:hypothetical protein
MGLKILNKMVSFKIRIFIPFTLACLFALESKASPCLGTGRYPMIFGDLTGDTTVTSIDGSDTFLVIGG